MTKELAAALDAFALAQSNAQVAIERSRALQFKCGANEIPSPVDIAVLRTALEDALAWVGKAHRYVTNERAMRIRNGVG